MPQGIRPDDKAMKIAYEVLKTPKEKQQRHDRHPSERLVEEWFRDSSMAQ